MNVIAAFTVKQSQERMPVSDNFQPVTENTRSEVSSHEASSQVRSESQKDNQGESKDFASMVKEQSRKEEASENQANAKTVSDKSEQADAGTAAEKLAKAKKKLGANAKDLHADLKTAAEGKAGKNEDAKNATHKLLGVQQQQLKKLVAEEEQSSEEDDSELGLLVSAESSEGEDTLVVTEDAKAEDASKVTVALVKEDNKEAVAREASFKVSSTEGIDASADVLEVGTGSTQQLGSDLKTTTSAENGVSFDKVDFKEMKTHAQNNAETSEPIVLVADRRSAADSAASKTLEPTVLVKTALQETGNTQIVQRAQFILKEAGSGEIRMTLKPEHLGTVRINLNLEDNRVLGRIVVESAEVKSAFDQNMSDLRERMSKAGLSMGELEVAVGNKDRQGQNFYEDSQKEGPFYSDRYREGSVAFEQAQGTPIKAETYRSVLVDMKA